MERFTARASNELAYLVGVKPNEQEVDSQYPNTLKCILASFQQLAAYEDTGLTPEGVVAMLAENAALQTNPIVLFDVEKQQKLETLQAENAELRRKYEAVVEDIKLIAGDSNGALKCNCCLYNPTDMGCELDGSQFDDDGECHFTWYKEGKIENCDYCGDGKYRAPVTQRDGTFIRFKNYCDNCGRTLIGEGGQQ